MDMKLRYLLWVESCPPETGAGMNAKDVSSIMLGFKLRIGAIVETLLADMVV